MRLIRTLEDLAAVCERILDTAPGPLRSELRDDVLLERWDGSAAVDALRQALPSLPASFLDVVRQWRVLPHEFSGMVSLDRVDEVIEAGRIGVMGLDPLDFICIGGNGAGDPICVTPQGSSTGVAGEITQYNHDSEEAAVLAPTFEVFLVGLGNVAACGLSARGKVEQEGEAGRCCQEALAALGWSDEIRRMWPGQNLNGAF